MKIATTLSTLALALFVTTSANANLLITQYYEGSSFNKWVELTNTGGSSVDLSNYTLGLWQNSNTEAYKTDGTPSQSLALTGTLASGASYLLSHTSAASPAYATADAQSGSVINHNGDDSFTLFTGSTFATANIVDAIGFTDSGSEGSNTSFVRTSSSAGWNTTAGSNVDDFTSVWSEITTASVDSAAQGTDARLGESTLIPEPASLALIGLSGLMIAARRRRQA